MKAEASNVFMNKGFDLFSKGDYQEALKQFDLAFASDSTNSDAKIQKGMCLYRLGQFKKAIDFLRVMDSWGPEPDTLSAYIECLIALGEIKKAESKFKSMDSYFEGEPEWTEVKQKLSLAKKQAKKTSASPTNIGSIESEWIKELDNFFKFLRKKTKQSVGAILIEWDKQGSDPEVHFYPITYDRIVDFEKTIKQYLTVDKILLKEEYSISMSKVISTKNKFSSIMTEACSLPSFNALKRQDPFYFVQQEHDTKVQFSFKHSS